MTLKQGTSVRTKKEEESTEDTVAEETGVGAGVRLPGDGTSAHGQGISRNSLHGAN